MNKENKKEHLAFMKKMLIKNQAEYRAWGRLGFPKEMLEMHKKDADAIEAIIKELQQEIEADCDV